MSLLEVSVWEPSGEKHMEWGIGAVAAGAAAGNISDALSGCPCSRNITQNECRVSEKIRKNRIL